MNMQWKLSRDACVALALREFTGRFANEI